MDSSKLNNPNIANDGRATRFGNGIVDPAQCGRNAAKKRSQNLKVKSILTKMLTATPQMSEKLKKQLHDQMGIDLEDAEMLTTAAMISVKLIQQALAGDKEAIRMVFEMAGQSVDARTMTDRERLKIERERLKIEKECSAIPDGDELPHIVIERTTAPTDEATRQSGIEGEGNGAATEDQ